MRFEAFSFGTIRIDGVTYEHDVVIDRGHVRKRSKKPSKKYRDQFGHTPLSTQEDIPWKCRTLVIGTGTGALPIMDEVKAVHENQSRPPKNHPRNEDADHGVPKWLAQPLTVIVNWPALLKKGAGAP